jgi:hypothetical protein
MCQGIICIVVAVVQRVTSNCNQNNYSSGCFVHMLLANPFATQGAHVTGFHICVSCTKLLASLLLRNTTWHSFCSDDVVQER